MASRFALTCKISSQIASHISCHGAVDVAHLHEDGIERTPTCGLKLRREHSLGITRFNSSIGIIDGATTTESSPVTNLAVVCHHVIHHTNVVVAQEGMTSPI